MPSILGAVLALVGLPVVLGGLGPGGALGTQRDDVGFFSTPTGEFTTPTAGLASTVLELGDAGRHDWRADRDVATGRLRADAGSAEVFVGIAPSIEVERSLDGSHHQEPV